MTEMENELLQTLLDLENKVRSMGTANPKPDLLPVFSRLDELTASLAKNTDPQLLHYLHKRSYEKARLFLQGREMEKGNC
ncbi:MAG: hypothetical protein ABJC04_04260 [Verrucomicrobiota bacterium]